MSVTVDANILLYASDSSSPSHEPGRRLVERLAVGPEIVYLFWPVIVAYVRIASHPAIFAEPLPVTAAITNVQRLLARPHVRAPGEPQDFIAEFASAALEVGSGGNAVADAHIVALMRQHEVRTIWTHDRDLRRFGEIKVRDPLG